MEEARQENKKEEQQEKLPLFSCAKISKFYLIPFISPVFCMTSNPVIEKFIEYNCKLKEIKFYITKIIFITQILGGCLLYFIYNENNKSNKKENQRKSTKVSISSNNTLIFNDVEKKKFKKALKIISIVSICDLLNEEFGILTLDQAMLDFRLFYLFFIVFFLI